MRWIGQHIWPFKSRFRSDAIIEKDSSLYMGDDEILSQTGGDTTLRNVTAIDTATKSTLDAALIAGDITAVAVGNGITGSSLTGPIPNLSIVGGDGITSQSGGVKVTPAQTTITSVLNNSLSVGYAAETSLITFAETGFTVTIDGVSGMVVSKDLWLPRHNTTDLGTVDVRFKNIYVEELISTNATVSAGGGFSGNATTATALATSRNFQADLASTSVAGFTGAANCTPGVTGTLAVGNGGTGLTSISTLLNSNVVNVSGTAATVTASAQPAIETIGTDGDTLTILADDMTMANVGNLTASKPRFSMYNTINNTPGPIIDLYNYRYNQGTSAYIANVNADRLGEINFHGMNSVPETHKYACIYADIHDITDSNESGRLHLCVSNHDGSSGNGLTLVGGSEAGEIDVTVGLGSNSVVTVPGRIAGDVTGDLTGTASQVAITQVSDDEENEIVVVANAATASGNYGLEISNAPVTINPSTGNLTATKFTSTDRIDSPRFIGLQNNFVEAASSQIGEGLEECTSIKTIELNMEMIRTVHVNLNVGSPNTCVSSDTIGHAIHATNTGTTTGARLTRLRVSELGIIHKIEMICLVAPTGGGSNGTDVDLYESTDGTVGGGADVSAGGSSALLIAAPGGAWTAGEVASITSGWNINQYLYLVCGSNGSTADYTGGKFLIRIHGWRDNFVGGGGSTGFGK